jgi:hypothetical protein
LQKVINNNSNENLNIYTDKKYFHLSLNNQAMQAGTVNENAALTLYY